MHCWGGYNFAPSATLTNNTISGNSATGGGGGVYFLMSSSTLTNNTISGNSAAGGGGGAYFQESSWTLMNNTISNNTATDGGGVYCFSSSPIIRCAIIAFNTKGGGLYVDVSADSSASNPTITYSDFYGNTGGDYVNLTSKTGHAGNISADPLFANAAAGDFHEKSKSGRYNPVSKLWVTDYRSSPCIDAGDPNRSFGSEPAPNGGRLNMGAYGNTPFASKSAPGVLSATYVDGTHIRVLFSMAMDRTTANIAANYIVSPTLKVMLATLQSDKKTVLLVTASQAAIRTYKVTVANVREAGGLLIGSTNNTGTWTTPTPPTPFAAIIAETGTGYATIQEAITAATTGQNVVVQPGIRHERIDFKGKAITVRSTDPSDPDVVAATVINGDKAGRVVTFMSGETASSVLSGLTITNGSDRGVFCYSASPTITNNTISGNSATLSGGGGLDCYNNSSPTVTNNIISGNSATQRGGGGVYCDHSSPTLTNNTITGNSAAYGGGVYCSFYRPRLTNNTISGNSGGGVYYEGSSSPIIKNCVVSFNTSGGGLHMGEDHQTQDNAKPEISHCDFYGNTGGDYVNWLDQTGTNGNISADPRFADAAVGDFRLKSQAGRWTGTAWVQDTVTSPCIDRGEPASAFANEPAPNGGRVNMGYDGNTIYASKSFKSRPTTPTAITVAPLSPGPEKLTATATGSTDANGDAITYKYQWSKKNADDTWGAWGNTARALPGTNLKIGDTWRVRAQAYDGTLYSAWKVGPSVKIGPMAVYTPAAGTTNVARSSSVYIDFRWIPVQSTVTSRVVLKQGTTVIAVTKSWVNNKKLRLTPKFYLKPNAFYRVYLSPGIECESGRVLTWGESQAYFVTAPLVAPAALSVAAAPTAAGAEISVNLSTAATVRTVICNIAGRVVAELPERDLPAGVSSLVWNGKGNSGTRVPGGTYLVRVEARGAEGERTAGLAAVRMR